MLPLKTVALVDDDQMYTNTFKKLLVSWQILNPFTFFADARKALDFMQIKEASAWPDILLLDLNMPNLNGWQFLEQFATIQPQKSISIYLVSSSIWEDDLRRAKQNTLVKEFISKPIFKNKLLDILS